MSLKRTVDLAEISARVCLFLVSASVDMWAELYLSLKSSGRALIPFLLSADSPGRFDVISDNFLLKTTTSIMTTLGLDMTVPLNLIKVPKNRLTVSFETL